MSGQVRVGMRGVACAGILAAGIAASPSFAHAGSWAAAPQEASPSTVSGPEIRLAAAAEQALRSHPAIAAGEQSLAATRHDVRAAQWLRFPSVSVQAVTRDDRFGVEPEVQVVQPLWTGGLIGGTIDRAEAGRGVAEARLAETALDILIRLSDAYFEIARTARLAVIYRDSLGEHLRLVDSMERRVAQEISPETDLQLARGRAAQVEQDLGLVTGQNRAALRRFRDLVGDDGFVLGEAPPYAPDRHHAVTEAAVDRALACHPTLRRLNAEMAVADADRRVARAAAWPQLGLQYSYDRFSGDRIGLVLRAQTNGGLAPFATADAAAARTRASAHALEAARLEILEAVSLDLVQNQSARSRVGAAGVAADSTGAVTESFLRQFVAGRRTWLDVMNSVREAVAARTQLVEVETVAMASAARIHLRACDWFAADGAPG